MTALAQRLLDEALGLPKEERENLMEALAESLVPSTEVPAEWQTEIASRLEQLESNEVKPVDWSEVQAQVNTMLTGK